MGKLIFLTGGVRSGKSRMAVDTAKASGLPVVFMATGSAGDPEMKKRIEKHKSERPKNWKTIEETCKVAQSIERIKGRKLVIIDCLTLFVSNLMLKGKPQARILNEAERLIRSVKKSRHAVIVVSNEVGSGIVPENRMARDFRDIMGSVNQMFAQNSDEAYAFFSGIPVKLK
jgi:adenosylcobinamide kinase/adenosylcobinamide-phosphate guanylyltransferase